MKHRMPAWRKLTATALSALLAFNLAIPAVPAYAEEDVVAAPTAEAQAQQPVGDTPEQPEVDALPADESATDELTSTEPDGTENVADVENVTLPRPLSDDAATENVTLPRPLSRPEEIDVTVEVIGPDSAGTSYDWVSPAPVSVEQGASAWSVFKAALDEAGIAYDAPESSYGVYINTITSPTTGEAYGWDQATGKFWQFFVNGEAASVGVDGYTLQDGDKVLLSYSAWGASDATSVSNKAAYDDADAQVTDLPSDWSQSEDKGNTTSAATPTTKTSVEWKALVGGNSANVSEPLLIGGNVYIAVGFAWNGDSGAYSGMLVRIAASTGKVDATGVLAGDIDYTTRPVYQDGIVYVPLKNGVVQAFNASTMKTRWVSAGTAASDQASCSLRIADGSLYLGTIGGDFQSGALAALDAATGSLSWVARNTSSGYYFTAPVRVGNVVCLGDNGGVMRAFDAATGKELGSASLGSGINADPVAYQGSLLVITHDGTLHKLSVGADGSLAETAQVRALAYSVATPTVVGDTAVVVGKTPDNKSAALALIDLGSMSVTRTVTKADGKAIAPAAIASAPLVSTQQDGTWCYFTRNCATYSDTGTVTAGGDLYAYRIGDAEAHLLYAPDSTVAQYCDSPVIADAAGNLYYLNDSGYLVKLAARAKKDEPTDKPSDKPVTPQDNPSIKPSNKPSGKSGANSAKSSGTSARPAAISTSRKTNAGSTGATPMSAAAQSGASTSAGENATASAQSASANNESTGTEESSATTEVADIDAAADAAPARRIPLWPIIGICLGAGLLIWLFFARRRKDEEDA